MLNAADIPLGTKDLHVFNYLNLLSIVRCAYTSAEMCMVLSYHSCHQSYDVQISSQKNYMGVSAHETEQSTKVRKLIGKLAN